MLSMYACTGLECENTFILYITGRVKNLWCEPIVSMLFSCDWLISGSTTEF